jgi:hypothetical protein
MDGLTNRFGTYSAQKAHLVQGFLQVWVWQADGYEEIRLFLPCSDRPASSEEQKIPTSTSINTKKPIHDIILPAIDGPLKPFE